MMFVRQARQKVVFKTVHHIQNTDGEMSVELQDAGMRWAKVVFLSKDGHFIDDQWRQKRRIRLIMRYDMEVDLRMRVVFHNRQWRVVDVLPVGERMAFLEIIAEEE